MATGAQITATTTVESFGRLLRRLARDGVKSVENRPAGGSRIVLANGIEIDVDLPMRDVVSIIDGAGENEIVR